MNRALPEWVAQHKRPGIRIRAVGPSYYAYERISKWDPVKKQSTKTTGKYLGKITPDGIEPARHARVQPVRSILEHGNIQLLHHFAAPLEGPLRQHFDEDAESLLAAGVLRIAYRAPLKNLKFLYDTTTTHQYWPDADVSDHAMTQLLRRVGVDWGAQVDVFRDLSKASEYAAIDLTQVFSNSENIPWLEKGYNADGIYHDQFQLLLLHSLGKGAQPTFLKLLPGSLRDAPTLANAVWESGLKKVVLVHDKGFTSEPNLKALTEEQVSYLAAVKRNATFLRYGSEDAYDENFLWRGRVIWAREYKWGKRRVLHFLDKTLRVEEESTFFRLVEEGKRKRSAYEGLRSQIGTLALVTDTNLKLRDAYELYKGRMEIEQAFDAMKNTLEADKSYMQSRESIVGYFFIVFLALFLYAGVLNHLRAKDLVSKYSVQDVMLHLSKVYKIVIGEEERVSEVPRKVRTLIAKLDLDL